MTQNSEPVIDLIAAQEQTPLAIINKYFLSGEFAPAPKKPITDKEVILGELTAFEKAIYSARLEVVEQHNALLVDAKKNLELHDPPVIELFKLMKINKMLEMLFWMSIRKRLAASVSEKELEDIGLRDEYKIVHFQKKSGDVAFDFIGSLISALEGNASHDCANCPAYDECDLPIKMAKGIVAAVPNQKTTKKLSVDSLSNTGFF